jgi:hypothetical protein
MNTSPIERLITHPRRGWIVTTATFVTALLFLLPAVDSYNLEKARLDEISVELDKSRTEITRFESWQHRIEEQGELLNQLEARAFIGPQVEAFRTELVDLIRKSNCTMRRVRLSEPSYRGWMAEHDDPLLDQPPHDAEGETPYSPFGFVGRRGTRPDSKVAWRASRDKSTRPLSGHDNPPGGRRIRQCVTRYRSRSVQSAAEICCRNVMSGWF